MADQSNSRTQLIIITSKISMKKSKIIMKKMKESRRWVCCMQKVIGTMADLWIIRDNYVYIYIYIYIYILHYYYATTMCFRRDWLRWWFLLIVAYPHNKLVCLCSVKFIKHFEHVSIFFILYIILDLNYFANFFWATNLEGVLSSFS